MVNTWLAFTLPPWVEAFDASMTCYVMNAFTNNNILNYELPCLRSEIQHRNDQLISYTIYQVLRRIIISDMQMQFQQQSCTQKQTQLHHSYLTPSSKRDVSSCQPSGSQRQSREVRITRGEGLWWTPSTGSEWTAQRWRKHTAGRQELARTGAPGRRQEREHTKDRPWQV